MSGCLDSRLSVACGPRRERVEQFYRGIEPGSVTLSSETANLKTSCARPRPCEWRDKKQNSNKKINNHFAAIRITICFEQVDNDLFYELERIRCMQIINEVSERERNLLRF